MANDARSFQEKAPAGCTITTLDFQNLFEEMDLNVIKVAVVYRVCPHWRAPIFARLNSRNDLHVKVFHGKGISGGKLVNTDTYDGFEHKMLFTITGFVKSSGRSAPFVFCPNLFFSLMRYNPDIILIEGGSNIFNNVLVYGYAKLFRKPIVWWTLGKLPGRKFSGLGKLYRRVVETMEISATALLGYSSVALNYFTEKNYPEEKCFRAVNCVDTEKVFADIERTKDQVPILRTELGLDGKQNILFVGAITDEKNIQRLIYAFAKVKDTFMNAHLLIVGDGPDRRRLERIVNDLNMIDNVTFTGQVIGDVAAYFELGDIFVLPGLGGLAISEAMAHGLPVICSGGDGCEVDFIQNGRTGFRLEGRSENELIDEFAIKIMILLEDNNMLVQMGENAKQIVLDRYNVHTYTENIVASIKYAHDKVK